MLRQLGLIFLGLFVFTFQLHAETPEQKGLRIAKIMEEQNEGFIGDSSDMLMVLIDAHGSRVERKMEGKVMEMDDDGDRSLLDFQSPLDVRGTKMLTWSHKDGNDDQWLYLPSVRRVKRISSSGQSSSFLGSEFSFEDLGSQEIEKFKYKFLKDDKIDEHDVWVLERTAKESSGYSKQVMFVRRDIKAPIKIEYYDRREELLKIAEFKDFEKFKVNDKNFHRASKIHMKNQQTRKESIFEWSERKLGVKHSKNDFEQRSLRQ
jgi:hypothetical protein